MSRSSPIIDGKGVASIARNLTYLLGGRGVFFVVRFFYAVILARVFGPRVYGMINYGIAWYMLFLPLTKMGLEIVLGRDTGQSRQQGDRTAATTLTLRIASIVLVTVSYLVLSWFMEDDPASRSMVLVFAFALIGRSLATWTENVYAAYEVNQYSFRQQSIFRPLEVVLGSLAVMIWREAMVVVAIHGCVWCCEAAYGMWTIHRRVMRVRLEKNLAELRRTFLQGLPVGATLLLMTLPNQGPLIFFRHAVPAGNALGQLALAMQVLFMFSQVLFALGSVSMPVLSRAAARQDGKDRLFAETALRYSLLFGTVLALLGTALGPWLTVWIFGVRYAQAGTLVGPVLWLLIPWSARLALERTLMARRLDLQTLLCASIGTAFFALTISEAIARYAALGAIWCSGMATLLTTLMLIYYVRGHLAMDLRVSLVRPGLAALSAAGVFYTLHAAGPVWSLLGAAAALAIGCRLFKCVMPQDREWFGQSFRWVAKKISAEK